LKAPGGCGGRETLGVLRCAQDDSKNKYRSKDKNKYRSKDKNKYRSKDKNKYRSKDKNKCKYKAGPPLREG
jgi:hypothetical protein